MAITKKVIIELIDLSRGSGLVQNRSPGGRDPKTRTRSSTRERQMLLSQRIALLLTTYVHHVKLRMQYWI